MGKTTPLRTCVLTGEELPQSALLRFVLGPNALVVPDLYNKLPGKGAWLKLDLAVLEQAKAKNPFARAFKHSCTLPENLPVLIENGLADRFYASLALMRRAGQLVFGFENVRKLLQSKETGVYLTASGAETDSRKTLEKLCGNRLVLGGLDAGRLGQVCGCDEIMHAATAESAAAARIAEAYSRYMAVKPQPTKDALNQLEDTKQ